MNLQDVAVMSLSKMKSSNKTKKKILSLFFLIVFSNCYVAFAQQNNLTLRAPSFSGEDEENIPSRVDIKAIPSFPEIIKNKSLIPIDSRLRLSVDNFIDAKTSMIGDYFKAHVLEDLFISSEIPQLVVPKGSWVRGRVSFIKKPNIFSKSGKIVLHLN